jgi:hypothetical protein
MIQAMVMNGTSQQQPGTTTSSSSSGGGSSMLREATPLMSRLEDVAGSIGGVGLAAAAAVLAVNSGLYTAELLGAGLSPWTSTSLEVRRGCVTVASGFQQAQYGSQGTVSVVCSWHTL